MSLDQTLTNEDLVKLYLNKGRPMPECVGALMKRGIKLKAAHEMIDKIWAELHKE
jgi:hypothetical protein